MGQLTRVFLDAGLFLCLQILQVYLVRAAFATALLVLSLCSLLSKKNPLLFIVIKCSINKGDHGWQVQDSLKRNRLVFYNRASTEPVHLDGL